MIYRKEFDVMRLKRKITTIIFHFVMIMFSFFMVYPLLWMIGSAFKPNYEIMVTSGELIPSSFTLENFINGWKGFGRYTYATFFKNSFFMVILRVIGATLTSATIAFGLARIRFRGSKILFALMISTMCIPGFVLQIPVYLMYSSIGLVGTKIPVILGGWFGNAYYVFLVMQFMRGIPKELDEAAIIDGCHWAQLFARIIVPLLKPVLATVAVLFFMSCWGDYYSSLIYLNRTKDYPVAYALTLYSSESSVNYGPMLAMSVLSLIPILTLFFLFQKQLIDGISFTGLKG